MVKIDVFLKKECSGGEIQFHLKQSAVAKHHRSHMTVNEISTIQARLCAQEGEIERVKRVLAAIHIVSIKC